MDKETQQTIRNNIFTYLWGQDEEHLVNIKRAVNSILEEIAFHAQAEKEALE